MAISLRYHGHANLEILSGPHTIQIDPFYTSNPLCDVPAAAAKPNFILISHAHSDHLGDAETIAKRTAAIVIANHEIAVYLAGRGVKNTHGMNTGGGFAFPFGRVSLTDALHTSSFPDGSYGGQANGFIIETGGQTIYFAGDTALFGDMALLGRLWKIDLAVLPIGDNYTMGPSHALEAINMLKPRLILPIHVNTFPVIQQDVAGFAAAVKKQTSAQPILLQPGESFEF